MKQHSFNRREFLKRAAVAGAGLTLPCIVPASVFGQNTPSNRITLGLIGMGLMMGSHHNIGLGREDTQVLAVCDVDRKKREQAKTKTEQHYGAKKASGAYKGCEAYNEYERIIERKDIDAVFVVTPDHWHAMISIAAMKSGKDVYVQKPMTLTVREGRLISDVARQYSAILQVGSQQRSERAFRKACEIVRNGWIGKVHTVFTHLGEFPAAQSLPEEPIPDGFDYDRWLGPTPWYPYNKKRVEGNYGGGWRCFWEYGSRKNGDWGAHHFDIIQNALGMDNSGPVEFIPLGFEGAKYQAHVYANGVRVERNEDGLKPMIEFQGTKGKVEVSRDDLFETDPADLVSRPLRGDEIHLYASDNHHSDFFNCVRTRQRPISDVEAGHRSATVCHLSGIAAQVGRAIRWDPKKEEIIGDAVASSLLDRPRRAGYAL